MSLGLRFKGKRPYGMGTLTKVLAALPENVDGWRVHFACFARAGFTAAAQELASVHNVQLITLQQLDTDLCAVL